MNIQLRRVVNVVNSRSLFTDDLRPYIGLEHITSWTGEITASDDATPEGLVTHFREGDILFGKLRPYLAKVTAPNFSGVCSTEAIVIRPRKQVNNQFLRYSLCSETFIGKINATTFGTKMPRANWENIGSETVWIPDLATQRQIADFLDRETARIDLLIEKKQKLVALLGEKYFADLERLTFPQQTPQDELLPFRWVCRIAEGQVDPTSASWKHRTLIAPNHIESKTGRLLALETAEEQGAISGKYAFAKGTVLYSKIRPALAKACISPDAGMCSADMYPIIPDKRLRPEYLLMQLLTARFTDWAVIESMRVAMPKINRETIGGFLLRVPALDLQDHFIEAFSEIRVSFHKITDKIVASIARLQEYRSALITAAVTGQMDVTNYAKSGATDRRLDAIQEEMSA